MTLIIAFGGSGLFLFRAGGSFIFNASTVLVQFIGEQGFLEGHRLGVTLDF